MPFKAVLKTYKKGYKNCASQCSPFTILIHNIYYDDDDDYLMVYNKTHADKQANKKKH